MNPSPLMTTGQSNMNVLFINPVIRRITKIEEKDETCVTYKGVTKKTAFFLLMVFAGAMAAFILHAIPFGGITDDEGIFVSYLEIGSLITALAFMVICPFLAIFLKKTTPVTGSLSCIGNGCVLGTIGIFLPDIRGAMLLAFLLTFALVGVLLFVYFSGKINITKRFRVVVSTLFGTVLLGSLFLGICYFIPGCRDIYAFIQNNTLLSVLVSLGGILIAMLFLLIDFDTVRNAVDKQLPAKYEWACAYSLAFTVIWLYFKVLDLIMTAQRSQNR